MSALGELSGLRSVWHLARIGMSAVSRWDNFPAFGDSGLQHALSVQVTAHWIMSILHRLRFDRLLVTRAVQYHDYGEPLCGGDVVYDHKSHARDLAEVEAFFAWTETLSASLRFEMRQAFMLQFCLGPHEGFLSDALSIARNLRQNYALEARIFELVERIDYLFSALEGFERGIVNSDETTIQHTLRNNLEPLDALVAYESEFALVWHPALRAEIIALTQKPVVAAQ